LTARNYNLIFSSRQLAIKQCISSITAAHIWQHVNTACPFCLYVR